MLESSVSIGHEIFNLYDTHGVPISVSLDIINSYNVTHNIKIIIDFPELITYANLTLKRKVYTVLKLIDESLIDIHGNNIEYHTIMVNLLNFVATNKTLLFSEKEIDKIIDMYKKHINSIKREIV